MANTAAEPIEAATPDRNPCAPHLAAQALLTQVRYFAHRAGLCDGSQRGFADLVATYEGRAAVLALDSVMRILRADHWTGHDVTAWLRQGRQPRHVAIEWLRYRASNELRLRQNRGEHFDQHAWLRTQVRAISGNPPRATRPSATPRERRATVRVRARSPGRDDPDPRRERPCAGCGRPFEPHNPRQRYHDERCATAARVRRHRASSPQRIEPEAAEFLERARLARHAIRAGADPLGALTLVVWPPATADEARRLLGVHA
jgi:hypothetical protein